jgi:AbrB family looped-hinge helix DNA binding protein
MLSTITSKGQITIPVDVRRATGLDVGMQVEFIVNARKRVELVPRHGDIRALRGAVPAPAQPVSVEAMSAAIATGWSGADAAVVFAHEPVATYQVPPPAGSKPGR